MPKPSMLLVTNLYNGAAEEDILLSKYLSAHFRIALAHPRDCAVLEDHVDVIFIHNSWPAREYPEEYAAMERRLEAKRLPVYDHQPSLLSGKSYLLDLCRKGYPVIPSVSDVGELDLLPAAERYFIKPLHGGCDAWDTHAMSREDLLKARPEGYVIQPFVEFVHEVSFYYIDGVLQYSLYAPDPAKRWDLVPFSPSTADLAFASRFVHWHGMKYGIERIDACRLPDGSLLLMEITDGGAYLSLELLEEATRQRFVSALVESINQNLLRESR